MTNDWLVDIRNDGPTYFKNVWIYRKRGDGGLDVLGAGEVVTSYKMGDAIPPSFRLDPGMLQGFMDALVEHGTKPKDAGMTEGELKAQSKHLEDLRQLLKLK